MAYTAWSVVFGEQPTAAKWNQLGENDAGFKDGTNIDNNAIIARHIAAGVVTAPKRSEVFKIITGTVPGGTGNQAYTGVGFQPKGIIFFMLPSDSTGGTGSTQFGATDGTAQVAYSAGSRITTTSQSYRDMATNRVMIEGSLTTGGSYSSAAEASLVSLNADGFTLNWNVVGSGSTWAAICFA